MKIYLHAGSIEKSFLLWFEISLVLNPLENVQNIRTYCNYILTFKGTLANLKLL